MSVLSLTFSHFCEESSCSPEEFFTAVMESTIPCREDRKLSRVIINLLEDYAEKLVEIEEDEELIQDPREFEEEFDPQEGTDTLYGDPREHDATTTLITFSDNRSVEVGKAKDALCFYRSSQKGTRTLSTMTSNFRFIKTPNDITKLLKLEQDEKAVIDRARQIEGLCELLRKEVFSKMDSGITLHDRDLQRIAREIGERLGIEGFDASLTWVKQFRKVSRIVSRRITKFVSNRSRATDEATKKKAEDFKLDFRALIQSTSTPNHCIANGDQSGFTKQLCSARALAPVGSKKIERLVESVSSTTHSYTVLPLIFADGRLAPKLFVVLAEKHGQFPRTFRNTASNLVVKCHTSHIMTKKLLKEWLEECVFTREMPDKLVLLLDSWTSFKDHGLIQSLVPDGKEVVIRNIPSGATSEIQPLDVFFFRIFKDFVRRVHEHVMFSSLIEDFQIHRRDNILLILEVVYNEFRNPKFQPFLQYSWKKAGYIVIEPVRFQTPVEVCFGQKVLRICENGEPCQERAFIQCSYCLQNLCFRHCFTNRHLHAAPP